MDREEFLNIFVKWENGSNYNDIYHMILYWINNHMDHIKKYNNKSYYNSMKHILERIKNNDETNNIVEDFIYGNRYKELRELYLLP